MRNRWGIAALLVAGALAVQGLFAADDALAHGEDGGRLPDDAPSVTPDGEKAKAEVERISQDPAAEKLTGDTLKESKRAVVRAHGASVSGDADGAELLSRVALAWATAAAAIVEAAEAERAADEAELNLKTIKERIERAKSLLNETEARRLQILPEIARAEADAAKADEARAEAERKRVDKSGKKPKKDQKKGAK